MIIHPKYKFFSQRLVLLRLSDVIDKHPRNMSHFDKIQHSIQKHGLLCPMVVDHKKHVVSGSHRLKVLKVSGLGTHSLFYKAQNHNEVLFFDQLNKTIFQQHKAGQVDNNLQFLFSPTMRPYTIKVQYLFAEPTKK